MQSVTSLIVSLGIRAIWNFSPTQFTLPSDAAFSPVFSFEPPACYRFALFRGETCGRNGSEELRETIARELKIGDAETRADGLLSLRMVPCRGMCAKSPVVSVNDGVLTIEGLADLMVYLRTLQAAQRQTTLASADPAAPLRSWRSCRYSPSVCLRSAFRPSMASADFAIRVYA